MKRLFSLLLIFSLLSPHFVFAVDYTQDAGCAGAFLMEADGNEPDVSVNGNTLTETSGDIPQSADKMFGTYSRDFERGDSEYLTHADNLSTDINGANQAVSLVLFLKREADSGTFENLVGKHYSTTVRQYFVYIGSGDLLSFGLSNDGSTQTLAAGATAVPVGSWVGIACVYDDTDMRIYRNGSLDSNSDVNPKIYSDGIANTTSPFYIGRFGTSTDYADGLIDDTGIFNRAITSVETSDINTNGLVGAVAAADDSQVMMIAKRIGYLPIDSWLNYRTYYN